MAGNLTGNVLLKDGSECYFDLCCQPCSEDGRQLEAEGYCTDCKEYLCKDCYDSHRKPRPCRHHVLLNKAQMPTQASSSTPTTVTHPCTIPCEMHPHEILKFFCETHDAVLCSVCVTLEHLKCTKTYIPDIPRKKKESGFETIKNSIDRLKTDITNIGDQAKQNLVKIQDIYNGVFDDVQILRIEINEMIDELEASLKSKADELRLKDTEKLQSLSDICDGFLTELIAHRKQLDSMRRSNLENDLFIKAHTTGDKLRALTKKLKTLNSDKNITYYNFKRSDDVWDFVNNSNAFGQLCFGKDELKDSGQLVAKHKRDVTVRVKGDTETPTITGCVVMPDQQIALVDYFNRKLKLCDLQSYEIVTSFALPGKPWDIARTGRQTVVLPFSDKEELVCFRIGKKRTDVGRNIPTSGHCIGVEFSKNRYFVVLLFPPRLEILDQDGVICKKVVSSAIEGISFLNPQYVTADNGNILVSDSRTNAVTIFSTEGKLRTSYVSTSLKSSLDLAADRKGNIFVCGCESNNIHVINRDGDFKQMLLTPDDVKGPQSMAYCAKTGRLFITQEYDQRLRIYQIEQG